MLVEIEGPGWNAQHVTWWSLVQMPSRSPHFGEVISFNILFITHPEWQNPVLILWACFKMSYPPKYPGHVCRFVGQLDVQVPNWEIFLHKRNSCDWSGESSFGAIHSGCWILHWSYHVTSRCINYQLELIIGIWIWTSTTYIMNRFVHVFFVSSTLSTVTW